MHSGKNVIGDSCGGIGTELCAVPLHGNIIFVLVRLYSQKDETAIAVCQRGNLVTEVSGKVFLVLDPAVFGNTLVLRLGQAEKFIDIFEGDGGQVACEQVCHEFTFTQRHLGTRKNKHTPTSAGFLPPLVPVLESQNLLDVQLIFASTAILRDLVDQHRDFG